MSKLEELGALLKSEEFTKAVEKRNRQTEMILAEATHNLEKEIDFRYRYNYGGFLYASEEGDMFEVALQRSAKVQRELDYQSDDWKASTKPERPKVGGNKNNRRKSKAARRARKRHRK